MTDCFMTHDWGLDELGRNNHERVLKVYTALKAKGITTWFDETEWKAIFKLKWEKALIC